MFTAPAGQELHDDGGGTDGAPVARCASSPLMFSPAAPCFLSVSFSGSGGMASYQLGVAACLQRRWDLTGMHFYGCSGGVAPAVLLALGIDIRGFFSQFVLAACREVRNSLGVVTRGVAVVERLLREMLPDDCAERLTGRCHLAVTRLPLLQVDYISEFTDKAQVFEVMKASAFIPLVWERALWTTIRGVPGRFVDGGTSPSGFFPRRDGETLFIYPWKWRCVRPTWYWPWPDATWQRRLFELGDADAAERLLVRS